MKAICKVLKGIMLISLMVFVITSCTKKSNDVVVDNGGSGGGGTYEEYVDLGLPSGTLWKNYNEDDFYTYDEAIDTFGDELPTSDQFYELIDECDWEWDENGFYVTGPNGNYIFLEAEGKLDYEGHLTSPNVMGFYWSSTAKDNNYAYYLEFSGGSLQEDYKVTHSMYRNYHSIRLVK